MNGPDPCKYEGKRVLLVEGKDDCHVILALCKHYKLPKTFGLRRCDSDKGVLKRLNALVVRPDPPEVVGVVLDADSPGIADRWRQVVQKLKNHGYECPKTPAGKGTILEGVDLKPDIGVWLMPDNRGTGMLEDFLMSMADEKALEAAGDCVEKAGEAGIATYKKSHHSKAVIHTYLAWQDEPGRPLGQAVTSHALKPETELAGRFVRWLKKLFN